MTPDSGKRTLLVTFFVALAIVTYQEIHDAKTIPRPRRYVSAGVVYGLLGVAAPFISYQLAGLLGVGMVLALMYQHYDTSHPKDGTDEDIMSQPHETA